jgi:hypothetical protein
MQQPNDFNFYFRRKNALTWDWYFVDSEGNVASETSGSPIHPLKNAPENWLTTKINNKRMDSIHGMFRALSTSIEFVGDAAKIGKFIHAEGGVEAELELFVQKFDGDTITIPNILDWDYKNYTVADVDFSTYSYQNNKISLNTIEGGFYTKYKAFSKTPYEISIDLNTKKKWVKLHSCFYLFKAKWLRSNGEVIIKELQSQEGVPTFFNYSNEGTNTNLGIFSNNPSGGLTPFTNLRIFRNESSAPITLSVFYHFDYNVFVPSANVGGFITHSFIVVNNIDIVTAAIIAFQDSVMLNPGQSKNSLGNTTINITLNPGEYVFTTIKVSQTQGAAGNGSGAHFTQHNSYITIDFDNPTKEGYFPAVAVSDVYKQLIEKIAGPDVVASSDLFENVNKDKLITSFDAIRNLPNSVLKISLDDLLTDLDAVHCTSLSFNKPTNTVNLEDRKHVYQNDLIANIGEVESMEIENYTAEMFLNLKHGYSTYTYDDTNGKDEANVEVSRTMPFTRILSEKIIKSETRTDMYGILNAYLNLNGKTSTDADSDNDRCFVHIDQTTTGTIPIGNIGAGEAYYNLYRDPTLVITNRYKPSSVFNIFYTTLRCLYRWGEWFRGLLHHRDQEFIKYQTSSKSNATGLRMTTFDGTTTLDEGADIAVNSLGDAYFLPYVAKIKSKDIPQIDSLLSNTPYGFIQWQFKGKEWYGYLLSIDHETLTHKLTEALLLLHPSSDLNNLS